MAYLLSIFGVLLVLEGLPYFAFPGRVRAWALMMTSLPDKNLRFLGLLAMAAGLFLLYIKRFF